MPALTVVSRVVADVSTAIQQSSFPKPPGRLVSWSPNLARAWGGPCQLVLGICRHCPRCCLLVSGWVGWCGCGRLTFAYRLTSSRRRAPCGLWAACFFELSQPPRSRVSPSATPRQLARSPARVLLSRLPTQNASARPVYSLLTEIRSSTPGPTHFSWVIESKAPGGQLRSCSPSAVAHTFAIERLTGPLGSPL